jgi:hypothetical protein
MFNFTKSMKSLHHDRGCRQACHRRRQTAFGEDGDQLREIVAK